MAQIFPRAANSIAKVSIVAVVILLGLLVTAAYTIDRGSFNTNVGVSPDQPVPLDHRVGDDGVDCRYCHTSVETPFATSDRKICMTCHSQIWSDSLDARPHRESYRTGKSCPGRRVHDLPDFVISTTAFM